MKKLIALVFVLAFMVGSTSSEAVSFTVKPQDAADCFRDHVTFFEDGVYQGRSWVLYDCFDPGYPYEVWQNVPSWFNDLASAVCIKSASYHNGWWLHANLYRDTNLRGYFGSIEKESTSQDNYKCRNLRVNDQLSSVGLVWVRH